MVGFKKATKQQAKLRAAFYGPSGSGKTFTALRVATGMGGKIAFIDSERGSASKYSDRFSFDVLELGDDRSIDAYVAGIRMSADAGYDVLVIDSLSHAWQELLEEIDRIAKAKFRGNTWSAWSEGTPKQHQLIEAILSYPGHVIATMRSKTEWGSEKNSNGKTTPTKVGLAPEQGKGIEYDFDLLISITTDHIALVEKDRTGKFQDKTIDKPGEDFGKALAAWLSDGVAAPPPPAPPPPPYRTDPERKAKLRAILKSLAVKDEDKVAYVSLANGGHPPASDIEMDELITELARRAEAEATERKGNSDPDGGESAALRAGVKLGVISDNFPGGDLTDLGSGPEFADGGIPGDR